MIESYLYASSPNVLIAFAAGSLTFLASCLVPLVPAYGAYIIAMGSRYLPKTKTAALFYFKIGCWFMLGFGSTFSISMIGLRLFPVGMAQTRQLLLYASGVLFLLFGMVAAISGLKHTWHRLHAYDWYRPTREAYWLHGLVAGAAFGWSWSPCIDPVLAQILLSVGRPELRALGLVQLLSYTLGLVVPFLFISLLIEKLLYWLQGRTRLTTGVFLLSVLILLLTGASIVLGQQHWLARVLQLVL